MWGAMEELLTKTLERWRLFWSLEAGRRFQTRYHNHRRRRQQGQTAKWMRLVNLIGGPALIVAGFAFVPTPGPSYIIIVVGMWMLAGELLFLARFFDRVEVRLRRLGRWIKSRWSRVPAAVKVLVVSICASAFIYGAYTLLSGG
jgi:Putative transmembrane protein (PGPGW)